MLSIVSAASACFFETSDDVPFEARDASAPEADMATARDLSSPDASTPDFSTAPLYPRETLPQGASCDDLPTRPPEYDCNPVTQDCGAGKVCELQISVDGFQMRCRLPGPGETFFVADGAACDTSSMTERCRIGAHCLSNVCRALCEFDGAYGCSSAMVCETLQDGPGPGGDVLVGYGVCIDVCRP